MCDPQTILIDSLCVSPNRPSLSDTSELCPLPTSPAPIPFEDTLLVPNGGDLLFPSLLGRVSSPDISLSNRKSCLRSDSRPLAV